MLPAIDPTQTISWNKLKKHYEKIKHVHMQELFVSDPTRFDAFSLEFQDILVDFSKNRISHETVTLLLALAEECGLQQAIEDMFSGEKINETENRAVLHTALRNRKNSSLYSDGQDLLPRIRAVQAQMQEFCQQIAVGAWKGYTQKRITDIVNIGIGGSDLGPRMVTESLKPYASPDLTVHFVSNVAGSHISETLKNLQPETTLFIIASKTFTTQETTVNAFSAREWFLSSARNKDLMNRHFIAISANSAAAEAFGIARDNVFDIWEWVGGRFSLWSAIGLSIACSIGYDNFNDMIEGAYEMDQHFRETPLKKNIPVLLAVIGIWYRNFFGTRSEVIIPYDQYMRHFPAYLRQANMESNGKSVNRAGQQAKYETGPVIWGEPGTNGQHAFFQYLHQGTKWVPADFLAPVNSFNPLGKHHETLLANFFAQTEALMNGKTEAEVREDLETAGKNATEITKLLPHKIFSGNRPTNSILYKKLTPRILGSLIAMYEHKIFVQGIIWNIYSFDQWGVELGKQLAQNIYPELLEKRPVSTHDSSTNGLINFYKKMRDK